MTKSKQQLLQEFKKSNKERRVKLAEKAGYADASTYLEFLTSKSLKVKIPTPKVGKIKVKPTIHIVDVLDASGSMAGWTGNSKYDNSKKGIVEGLSDLKNNKDVNYTYTLIEFVQSHRTKTHTFLGPIPEGRNLVFNGALGGDTPLYFTVYDVLTKLQHLKANTNDRVLVKVYTDGLDNAMRGYQMKAALLIRELQLANFTVTFVATEMDLEGIIRDLNIDRSNTLAVTNDAAGFERAFERSRGATMTYSNLVASGQSVDKGFYTKKVGKL